jgi:hypothetical protein
LCKKSGYEHITEEEANKRALELRKINNEASLEKRKAEFTKLSDNFQAFIYIIWFIIIVIGFITGPEGFWESLLYLVLACFSQIIPGLIWVVFNCFKPK